MPINLQEIMVCLESFSISFGKEVAISMYNSFMGAKLKKELSASQRQTIIKLWEKLDKEG